MSRISEALHITEFPAEAAEFFEELYGKTEGFLDEMLGMGVTTCEAKSGYGLDLETEIKMLEVLKKLNEDHPVDVVSTFMGAHAIPEDYKPLEDGADQFIDVLCNEMLWSLGNSVLSVIMGHMGKEFYYKRLLVVYYQV